MKRMFDLARLAFLSTTGLFMAAAADAADQTNYLTAKEITAMTPCWATFAKRVSEYSGFFTNTEGKAFIIGDSRGEQAVWHFVCALKEGQTCKFPEVFTSYLAAPNYVTAREIAAMTPCTATLASRSPCSSTFITPEGKWFGIGDPGSPRLVSHFIWSLEDGQTCKFPDAFLKFQTNAPPKQR